jgi:hypothetical protein
MSYWLGAPLVASGPTRNAGSSRVNSAMNHTATGVLTLGRIRLPPSDNRGPPDECGRRSYLLLVGAFTILAAARASRFVFLVAVSAFLELAFARAMVVLRISFSWPFPKILRRESRMREYHFFLSPVLFSILPSRLCSRQAPRRAWAPCLQENAGCVGVLP